MNYDESNKTYGRTGSDTFTVAVEKMNDDIAIRFKYATTVPGGETGGAAYVKPETARWLAYALLAIANDYSPENEVKKAFDESAK
jgi:hypothetical protein